jgi:hypothetical protein
VSWLRMKMYLSPLTAMPDGCAEKTFGNSSLMLSIF